MVWCNYCSKDQETESDDINGFTCCTGCGRVLDDNVYSTDPTFLKTADGGSQAQGSFIRDNQYSRKYGGVGSDGFGYISESHEKTLEKGRNEIKDIADYLSFSSRDDTVTSAHRLYTIAVERNFTRGRRTNQVAAACLYIICRQDEKPYLLIDFCDFLQTNVYALGAVFLQLCALLRLEQHPLIQKPVDPSLFIHRFADRLVGRTTVNGKKFHIIANTALRLVASMKRDWLQTGRRPSGICGAALFVSAHIHGFQCTKADVVSIVHICEGTLTKRLIEFESTESGSLTPEEFEARAKEIELQHKLIEPYPLGVKEIEKGNSLPKVICEHKDLGVENFALGLCRACYGEFVQISGGMVGGTPPAFQRAEQKRMEEAKHAAEAQKLAEKDAKNGKVSPHGKGQGKKLDKGGRCQDGDVESREKSGHKVSGRGRRHQKVEGKKLEPDGALQSEDGKICKGENNSSQVLDKDRDRRSPDTIGGAEVDGSAKADVSDSRPEKLDNLDDEYLTEEVTLSDIDDNEVEAYLNNDEEVRLKTIIWTEMNKEYLEEQQAKEEALAASLAAQAAVFAEAGETSASAVELAMATAIAVAELKKDRKRKRLEAKNRPPAESATEATRQMLKEKRLSSKVNYSALEKLFDGDDDVVKNAGENETGKSKTVSGQTEKHVTWADEKTKIDLSTQANQINTENISKKSTTDNAEEDMEGEDFEDKTIVEDETFPIYQPSYEQDDGGDEYYEYY